MFSSYTLSHSASETFTVTHARHMAAKVATDLKRIQRLYGGVPTDRHIAEYEVEVNELLKAGYLGTVTYGFWRNGKWIEPALRYTAKDLAGLSANDEDPGKIRASADTAGASFHSYLTYTGAWDLLSATERDVFKKQMPFYRGGAEEPGIDGYLTNDRTYSAGGRALDRASVRSFR